VVFTTNNAEDKRFADECSGGWLISVQFLFVTDGLTVNKEVPPCGDPPQSIPIWKERCRERCLICNIIVTQKYHERPSVVTNRPLGVSEMRLHGGLNGVLVLAHCIELLR